MATVLSTLELCSFCRGVMARCFLKAGGENVLQSREDLLNAQHKCYICTWIGYSLGSEALNHLPQNLMRLFRFLFDGDRWSEPDGQYERLILGVIIDRSDGKTVDGLPLALYFYTTNNAESTNCFPLANSEFRNSQLSTLAENWIKNCRQNHAKCTPAESDFRPKRLIQIIDEDHWRLVLPRNLPLGDNIDYVALSHCWGGSTQLLKLTRNNQCQLQGRMRVQILPKTFKEAISACLELKFHYLWIYSLCIIQDIPADWQEQAAEMDSVYRNAVLNLCMAGSANPSEASLLSRDTDLMLPLSITLTDPDGNETAFHMVCNGMFEGDIRGSPLRKRGWVLQEWYLAKRSLIFGRMQLWWHCCEELACETFPGGTSVTTLFTYSVEEAETMKLKESGRLQDPSHYRQVWWDLIKQYAETKLTEETKDRVIAFSGISRVFGKSHNIEDQYAAGMWRCHLPQALLWYRFCGDETYRSLEGYKAPSWSWMSLDGPITLRDISERKGWSKEQPLVTNRHCCSFEQVHLPLVDTSNVTGRLKGGSIQIRGHLLSLNTEGDKYAFEKEISLSHFGQDHDMGEICWDEEDKNGDEIVSYLENIAIEPCQEGLVTEFARTRVPLENANGSIFAFPILHQTHKFEIYTDEKVLGLILYQPPHQSDIFYRIACYRTSGNSDFTGFMDGLKSHFTVRSICII